MAPEEDLRIKDGVVSGDPGDFAKAVDRARRDNLEGIWISPDHHDKDPKAPVADLSLLEKVPGLRSFGIAEMSFARIANFEAIYALRKVTKLAIRTYKKLDLGRFPQLETLLVTDGPGLTGVESLKKLRFAEIKSLRADDLSFLGHMPDLGELRLILAKAKKLRGLETSPSVATLELAYCRALASVSGLPKGLDKLKVEKCPHLQDLAFLAGHPSLTFLSATVIENLAFVPRLPRLDYINFQDVVDGDLAPLLASKSLSRVGFAFQKKHFSHTEKAINEALAKGR